MPAGPMWLLPNQHTVCKATPHTVGGTADGGHQAWETQLHPRCHTSGWAGGLQETASPVLLQQRVWRFSGNKKTVPSFYPPWKMGLMDGSSRMHKMFYLVQEVYALWKKGSLAQIPHPSQSLPQIPEPKMLPPWHSTALSVLRSPCISYLLLHNKLTQNLAPANNKYVIYLTVSETIQASLAAGPQAAIKVGAQLCKDSIPRLLLWLLVDLWQLNSSRQGSERKKVPRTEVAGF